MKTNFKFRFGLDAGKGGDFLIDNNPISYWTNDVWWAGDWNNGGVQYGAADFEPGTHKIIVYSGEGCCDGG